MREVPAAPTEVPPTVLPGAPAPTRAPTAAHASPLLAAENVTPSSHDAHCRSAVAEPATDMPEPAAHVRQALVDSLLSTLCPFGAWEPHALSPHGGGATRGAHSRHGRGQHGDEGGSARQLQTTP